LLYVYQNAGLTHDIRMGRESFEDVAQFKYFGTTVTSKFDSGGD
jgi:hypothetical protein